MKHYKLKRVPINALQKPLPNQEEYKKYIFSRLVNTANIAVAANITLFNLTHRTEKAAFIPENLERCVNCERVITGKRKPNFKGKLFMRKVSIDITSGCGLLTKFIPQQTKYSNGCNIISVGR